MEPQGEVTLWIKTIKAGAKLEANEAFRKIWTRYSRPMNAFARKRLHGGAIGQGDEEDVVQSVFRVVYERIERDGIQQVKDSEDLWKLLLGITAWKARDRIRKEGRRSGGKLVRDADVQNADGEDRGIDQLAGSGPTPEASVALSEEVHRMLNLLGEEGEELRKVAELKLEGHEDRAIAEALDLSLRTVQRKLFIVREAWSQEFL